MNWHVLTAYTAAAQWAFMFVLSFCVDVVWARWSLHVAAHHRWRASAYSVGIVLLGAVSVIWYIEDHLLLIPIAAGSFIGTFIAVKPVRKNA
jgi:hypothetical protein